MFTIFGIPDRKKKKRNLLIGQPEGSLSESRWFVVFICFNLKFTFSCGLPTWRLIPDQFKWCSAAAGNVAFVASSRRATRLFLGQRNNLKFRALGCVVGFGCIRI